MTSPLTCDITSTTAQQKALRSAAARAQRAQRADVLCMARAFEHWRLVATRRLMQQVRVLFFSTGVFGSHWVPDVTGDNWVPDVTGDNWGVPDVIGSH